MKFHYYPETDSLYIGLIDKPSTDSQEVSTGVVLDSVDRKLGFLAALRAAKNPKKLIFKGALRL